MRRAALAGLIACVSICPAPGQVVLPPSMGVPGGVETVPSTDHTLALQALAAGDYSAAADRYREYLNKFPFANQYYQTQFYLAEALFDSPRLEEAIVEYNALLKVPGEEWTEAAQFRIFLSWFNLLNQRYGDLAKLPAEAVVERTEETKTGEQRNIYMLSDLHKEFIKSADAMKVASFKNETWETARK
jgi:tetratricopeptide (TPR) repeat protein